MNITVLYQSYYDEYKRFVFVFNDLDGYEVIEYMDKETGYVTDYTKLEEVTRLLNAFNAFRQWKPEQKYSALELRKALEDIVRKHPEGNIWKSYRFAILGTAEKVAEKIFSEIV